MWMWRGGHKILSSFARAAGLIVWSPLVGMDRVQPTLGACGEPGQLFVIGDVHDVHRSRHRCPSSDGAAAPRPRAHRALDQAEPPLAYRPGAGGDDADPARAGGEEGGPDSARAEGQGPL